MNFKNVVTSLSCLIFTIGAQAQTWPSKTVRLIVPYAAGGPADLVARELSQILTNDLKQTVAVENMGGAMGVPALSVVARSEPDGHTWLMAAVGNTVIQPLLSKHGGSDLVAKLKPFGPVSTAPHILVVTSKLPIKTLSEFIEYAKTHPGQISFASAGTGGTAHLGMEMFKLYSGTQVIHVPYKGSAGSVNDLISGQVSALLTSPPSIQPLVEKGYVRVLAATAPSALSATRSLPLMSSALPGYEYSTWYAMYIPINTPKELTDHLNQVLNKALKNPQLLEKVQAAGTEIHGGTQEEVLQWTRHDLDKWQKVIQSANINVE